ncbi:MAG: fluoride efflux transporter CrcB [Candidatus Omnitrophica bacterium]|nr:fluoride efflux transporter CrcB [Candidatus Omnitrophota bacterium]MBU1997532.1 fluoride efflux transporter CrcB [Candidatus Omnitrophota bacterium]MBU4332878.1 fluoride efflux transporter CrcB [Candidatus Omnitrophota bacterium]
MTKVLLLCVGGAFGTVSRYLLSTLVYRSAGSEFPYGTMLVNLLGCFIVGVLATLSESKYLLTPNLKLLLIIGFCGAFTTFSAFILETANLMKDGETTRAFLNVFLSLIVGFLVLRLGVFIGENL